MTAPPIQDVQGFARLVAQELHKLQTAEPKSEHVTFKEAMQYLNCKYGALNRKLESIGVVPYRYGKGMAFPRKHLERLVYQ